MTEQKVEYDYQIYIKFYNFTIAYLIVFTSNWKDSLEKTLMMGKTEGRRRRG